LCKAKRILPVQIGEQEECTMNRDNRTHKRKQYFIKKKFQFQFILKFCLLLLGGVIISTVLLFSFSKGTLTSSFQDSRLIIENTGSAILPAVIYTNLITLGVITVAAIGITLFVSHKIAGPLYRFENELRDVSQGNLTKQITLRRKDQMTEVVEGLNDMISNLHERVSDIQSQIDRLVRIADSQSLSPEIRDQLKRLQERMNENFTL